MIFPIFESYRHFEFLLSVQIWNWKNLKIILQLSHIRILIINIFGASPVQRTLSFDSVLDAVLSLRAIISIITGENLISDVSLGIRKVQTFAYRLHVLYCQLKCRILTVKLVWKWCFLMFTRFMNHYVIITA